MTTQVAAPSPRVLRAVLLGMACIGLILFHASPAAPTTPPGAAQDGAHIVTLSAVTGAGPVGEAGDQQRVLRSGGAEAVVQHVHRTFIGPWMPTEGGGGGGDLVNVSEPRPLRFGKVSVALRYDGRPIASRFAALPPLYKSLTQAWFHPTYQPFPALTLPEFAANETWQPDDESALCVFALLDTGNCDRWTTEAIRPTPADASSPTVSALPDAAGGDPGTGALFQCMASIGVSRLRSVLPGRCINSAWFRAWTRHEESRTGSPASTTTASLRRGPTFEAQVTAAEVPSRRRRRAPTPYDKWPKHRFGPPVRCASTPTPLLVHPISFAIPTANLVQRVERNKLWDFVPFVPMPFPVSLGTRYPLRRDHEWLSEAMQRFSFYGFTHKRGGCDCLRHYELLANGVAPYFADLPMCSADTVTSLPRDLIVELMLLTPWRRIGFLAFAKQNIHTPYMVRQLPTKASRKSTALSFLRPAQLDHAVFNTTRYFELADRLLQYSRSYLTTASLAAYVLSAGGGFGPQGTPQHVLLFLPPQYDYMAGGIMIGLYELGIQVTAVGDWHEILFAVPCDNATSIADCQMSRAEWEAVQEARRPKHIQGGGWFNGFRIPAPVPSKLYRLGSAADVSAIEAMLIKRVFNAAIYVRLQVGAPPSWPLWGAVEKHVPFNRRMLIDAWDARPPEEEAAIVRWAQHGVLFRREISPWMCARDVAAPPSDAAPPK